MVASPLPGAREQEMYLCSPTFVLGLESTSLRLSLSCQPLIEVNNILLIVAPLFIQVCLNCVILSTEPTAIIIG